MLAIVLSGSATARFLQRGSHQSMSLVAEDVALFADPVLKLVNKTSIKQTETADCLCELGSFWHWRIHSCVKQGPWGYECGFFPGEHHHRVCLDGLKCSPVVGAKDTYTYHGEFQGTASSFPASCVRRESGDGGKVGTERHNEECLQAIDVAGEACATVRVTAPGLQATAKATADHTATAKASKTATVNDETATHEATESTTATSSATATRVADGVAESTACVTVSEVKKELDLEKVKEMGKVLAQKIISEGDKMAFERASEFAMAAARKAGLLSAKNAASQAAQGTAAEKAKLEAERLAAEAAAWKAEAGANTDAQAAANARAKALAKEQAAAAAAASAAREAEAEAARKAAAEAEGKNKAAAQAGAASQAVGETLQAQADAAKQAADKAIVAKEPDTTNDLRKISDKQHNATLP